ncbi:MAG: cardiolipin synthase [Chitinophagaceae bacterium]
MSLIVALEVLYVLLMIASSLHVVYNYKDSGKAFAYLILILFLPVLGTVIYLLLGLNKRKHKMYNRKLIADQHMERRVEAFVRMSNNAIMEKRAEDLGRQTRLARLLSNDNYTPLTPYNKVDIFNNGENAFPAILDSLRQARNHIHIEYYIIEDGKIFHEIMEILLQKAQQGVQVRVIFDDFGSKDIRKAYKKELQKGGVEIYPFLKLYFVALANRINYRNHRKIIIIDGYTAFTGGINISDRYCNTDDTQQYWRDTHLKIEGYGAYPMQSIFLADWNFCSGQHIEPNNHFFPELPSYFKEQDTIVQIASCGPDSTYPTILYAIIAAISAAKSEILITTPYFIPPSSLLNTLRIAALSGVHIKILVPYRSDSRVVNMASASFFDEILDYGIEVYQYEKGFVHSKVMVCDRELAIVGTANMDIRSFDLNFEINVQVYDKDVACRLADDFANDLRSAQRIDPEQWQNRPIHKKMVGKIFRLASSLM